MCNVRLHSQNTANILREIEREHQSESAEIYQVQGELALTTSCRRFSHQITKKGQVSYQKTSPVQGELALTDVF